ncbi:MAG: 3-hydroxyacyl-CoA dehydrogenase family protein [Deltaproteobacteria bacterium]|nr:3-hydroxyacyl-CoA dehydrogenase family protein [Deltaproteobacteria bacterium]
MVPPHRVAVVGAGVMGAEIALCFALKGTGVLLKDINLDLAMAGKKRIEDILSKWEGKGKIEEEKIREIMGNIIPKEDYGGFDETYLVIEAVLEDFDLKSSVFKELDEVCKGDCIFASNTSSIPIAQLAAATARPSLFIGMHFFSPASVMRLVEVIPGLETSEETTSKVMDIVRYIGKEPIRVEDRAGFLVNRLLFAFFNEAWRIVDEGAATTEDIDRAVKLGLGHPVGIFQLQDLVGLDNTLEVTRILEEEYGERFKPAPILKRKVAANHLGRKTKRGWFDYRG